MTWLLALIAGVAFGSLVVRPHWRRRLWALVVLIVGGAWIAIAYAGLVLFALVVTTILHANDLWASVKGGVGADFVVRAWRLLLSGEADV